MPSAPPSLPELTRHALTSHATGGLLVAYSGGHDSSVLLHVLANTPTARARGLRALHVNHGLHADADRWAQHCQHHCATLGVPLRTITVNAHDVDGLGPEAAARAARYQAFAQVLAADEWLLLAQHREDQAETVLLKLLRGAGPQGLAGMRALRRFDRGWLWRPWLHVPRHVLRDYASTHALDVIDDPANVDPQLARSFLRQDIMPRLRQHWPNIEAALTHAATLCRDAADYINTDVEFALQQLRTTGESNSLDADAWLALDSALRAPTLHHWLHQQGLPAPTSAQRRQLEQQIALAAADRVPQVNWPGAVIRLWRKRLYAMPRPRPIPAQWRRSWEGQHLPLPSGGALYLSPNGPRLHVMLEVRLREGGERLQPANDPHTRELRDLLQRANIPPWLRPSCPLIYAQGELIAVADLFTSQAGEALFTQLGARPCWQRSDDMDAPEPLH